MKRILFVCKFNHTRSQIARALFEKFNKNNEIIADSMGVIRAKESFGLKFCQKELFKKYHIKKNKPKYLDKEILNQQKWIVIMADDVPSSLFNSQKKKGIKVIKLKIKDGHKYNAKTRKERLERVYLDIEKRIKKLIPLIIK